MQTDLLIISSLLQVTFAVTDIVQREGSNTTMSCKMRSSNWTSCVFKHNDASEAECSILPGQGNLQPCGGSSLEDTQIQITEDGSRPTTKLGDRLRGATWKLWVQIMQYWMNNWQSYTLGYWEEVQGRCCINLKYTLWKYKFWNYFPIKGSTRKTS